MLCHPNQTGHHTFEGIDPADRSGIRGIAAAAIEGVKGFYTAGFTFLDNLTGGKLSAIKDMTQLKMPFTRFRNHSHLL